MTRVVHIKQPHDVYIGRPSIFGNPFKLKRGVPRSEAIERYREWFMERVETDSAFATAVHGLRGQRLACWCSPKPCHGDVIAAWLDK